MPRLPIVREQTGIPAVQYPRPATASFGGHGFEALGEMGETFQKIAEESRKQQDALDFAVLSGEYDARLEELKESIKEEQNYEKRPELYSKEALKVQQEIAGKTTRPGVKQALNLHFAKKLPKEMIEVKTSTMKDWNSTRLATLEQVEDTIADQIIASKDPADAARLKGTYRGLVEGFSTGPYAALKPLEGEKRLQSFESKIDSKRARAIVLESPAAFLDTKKDDFKNLTDDQFLGFQRQAREALDREEKRSDKIFKGVQDHVETLWSAAANRGELKDSDLETALSGRHPYITPDKARQLKQINENPLIGEGADQIRAIMTEYHSDESSVPRIRAIRKQLNALVRQGVKSPLLDKALDELQTDQRTMESIEATRVNRSITEAQTSYEANRPVLPFNLPLFTNKEKQDKAKIAEEVRKGRDPSKVVTDALGKKKADIEKIPEKHKKVMELGQ